VTTTPEVGLIGATDAEQLEHAMTNERVIFTQDSDFLMIHRSGEAHNGIVFCPMESRSIGQIIRGLVDVWDLLEPEEIVGRVEFL
jgi:predicted nuclease of predicted toxin-antitoxin system